MSRTLIDDAFFNSQLALRKPREINLTALAAVALSMTARGSQTSRLCRQTGRLEPDSFCQATGGDTGMQTQNHLKEHIGKADNMTLEHDPKHKIRGQSSDRGSRYERRQLRLLFLFLFRTLGVGKNLFRNQLRNDIVMIHFHSVAALALCHRSELGSIGEHFSHGNFSIDDGCSSS